MNKANKKDYQKGSLKTVDYSSCVDRLERLCGIKFIDNDKKAFENLRERRNCVEHFKSKESIYAMETVINNALTATMNFLHNCEEEFTSPSKLDLNDDNPWGLSENEKRLMDEITQVVATLTKHYNDAIKIATERADKEGLCLPEERVQCPFRNEKLLIPDAGRSRCYFCGYEADGVEAANDYLYNVSGFNEYRIVKDGGVNSVYRCPDCGKDSFINVGDKFECLSCRTNYPIDEIAFCEDCGEVYWRASNSIEDIGRCGICIERLKESWK